MERVRALINKLQEQLDQHTDPSSMAVTAQMLQAELRQVQYNAAQPVAKTKISVMLPSNHHSNIPISPAYSNSYVSSNGSNATIHTNDSDHSAEVVVKKVAEKNGNGHHTPSKKTEQSGWLFGQVLEVPTLAHQDAVKELNDVIGNNGSSLNDSLKTKGTELAEVLTESPIKDLKKGIGVNDRYVFINELFRGDETMYERSIKTINNFHILQEAEFWMERELKLKLGWNEGKERVQHFYQLVKRRFA